MEKFMTMKDRRQRINDVNAMILKIIRISNHL